MKGIRQDHRGYQAFVKVRGQFYSKRFPFTKKDGTRTTLAELKEWRTAKRASIEQGVAIPLVEPNAPSFADDAIAYLKTIGTMPSASDRQRDILTWMKVFGSRPRSAITALEIRTALAAWRKTHSGSTCNKLRTALMSMYTTLDGKSARNPVRDIQKYQETDPEPRELSYGTIYRILACMRPSKTRARLRVIAWTGWPHAQLKRLKREHVDLKAGRAYVTPRRKGKGRKGGWLPLLPGAIIALREFDRRKCYTEDAPTIKTGPRKGQPIPFSNSAMHSAFARALTKLNGHRARLKLRPITARPYDLRHSFGTMIAERITDERAIQELMMHSRAEQTRRYTEGATRARVESAARQIAAVHALKVAI